MNNNNIKENTEQQIKTKKQLMTILINLENEGLPIKSAIFLEKRVEFCRGSYYSLFQAKNSKNSLCETSTT